MNYLDYFRRGGENSDKRFPPGAIEVAFGQTDTDTARTLQEFLWRFKELISVVINDNMKAIYLLDMSGLRICHVQY